MNIDSFNNSKTLGLLGGVLAIIIAGLVAAWWIVTPSWVTLIDTQESPETKAEIQSYLMKWNIPYHTEEATGEIQVQDTVVLAVRNRLSELGIPAEEAPGFEIFNDAEYGMSEFTQRINYQRAIEAEIAKTIRTFAGVKNARVHLSIPKESIFNDGKSVPKASVTVQLRPEQYLSGDQVEGIQRLVAASVDKLEEENVIVLSESGEVISSSDKNNGMDMSSSKQDLETAYARKAKELAYGVTHVEDINVAVDIKYNYDKVKSVKEQIIPSSDKNDGYLVRESRQSSKNGDATSKDSTTQSNNTSVEHEYTYSKERSEIEYAPGKVEKVSVGIVINKDLSDLSVVTIEKLVIAGLGLDMKRGDQITVVTALAPELPQTQPMIETKTPTPVVSKTEKAPTTNDLPVTEKQIIYILAGTLALFIILFIWSLFRKPKVEVAQISDTERNALLLEIKQWAREDV